MQQQQPFDRQITRDSGELQTRAAHPLKSMTREESLVAALQDAQIDAEAARRAVYSLQAQLQEEATLHEQAKMQLRLVQEACERLGCLEKIKEELHRGMNERDAQHAEMRDQQQNFQGGHKTDLSGLASKDIRVHGGSGNLNKFAFGSDQLQSLIDQHDKSQNSTVLSHHRRSSIAQEELAQQREAQADQESARRQHFNRLSAFKASNQDSNTYDIFGNVVAPTERRTEPVQQPETDDIFNGMGAGNTAYKNHNARGRHETDLRADKHFANSKMWRGASSSNPTASQMPEY